MTNKFYVNDVIETCNSFHEQGLLGIVTKVLPDNSVDVDWITEPKQFDPKHHNVWNTNAKLWEGYRPLESAEVGDMVYFTNTDIEVDLDRITPSKAYKLEGRGKNSQCFTSTDNKGGELILLLGSCAHLRGNPWRLL